MLLAASVVGSAPVWAEEDRGDTPHEVAPAPDRLGPWAVGRTTFQISDPARNGRTLDVDAWYPVDPEDTAGVGPSVFDLLVTSLASEVALDEPPPSSHGPFPLVVFSHGSGGIRFQSWFLTEALASHGFVVVAPDHKGNTALDGLFGTSDPNDVVARNRPLDVSLVIDVISRFSDVVDGDRVAVVGHSFGGFTALASAVGWQDVPPDSRVDAIVPIAAAAGPFSDDQLRSIDLPTLLLSGTSDITVALDPNTTRTWGLIDVRGSRRIDIHKAGHSSFTNVCDLYEALAGAGLPPDLLAFLVSQVEEGCAPELIPIAEAHRLTTLYTVAFLRWQLVPDEAYHDYLRTGYARANHLQVKFFK
jgi:predicted dienelactone hydrolase